MSNAEARAETVPDEVSLERDVRVSRYPGHDPVIVRTTEVPGEEPSSEERMLAGLRRLAYEGRITLPS
jgi:hypothetical protein